VRLRRRLPFHDDRLHVFRVVFSGLDLEFIKANEIDPIMLIADKCVVDIERDADWTSQSTSRVLDFVDTAFDRADELLSAPALSYIIKRMNESLYLGIENNLAVVVEFCLRVFPRSDDFMLGSKHTNELLRGLGRRRTEVTADQVRMIDELLGIYDLGFPHTISVRGDNRAPAPIDIRDLGDDIRQGLVSFEEEPDWDCHATRRMIESVAVHMKIGASHSTQETAYHLIGAMINSDLVFSNTNLNTLSVFLLRTGPALDGMAYPGPSKRLTNLLKQLKANASGCTQQQIYDIEGLCRNLGREDMDASEEEEKEEREKEEEEENLLI
jgi:hypothetical protein